MWTFASHASTGIAVAGLSATYYALARKNAQLERESSRISQDGDCNRTLSSMTMSQMLLKQEMNSLSRGSGQSLGLNALDSSEDIKSVSSNSSGTDIQNMVNRVQNNLSSATIVNTNLSQGDLGEVEEQKSNYKTRTSSMNSRGDSNSSGKVFAVEEYSDSSCQTSNDTIEDDEPSSKDFNERKASARQLIVESCSSINLQQRSLLLERTRSPVLCYLNPEFGKRTAGRQSMHLSEPSEEKGDNDLMQSESKEYKDSTRFLFPPILSDSRLSVYDEEQQLPVDEEENNQVDKSINVEMDKIRDYNFHLQMEHGLGNWNKELLDGARSQLEHDPFSSRDFNSFVEIKEAFNDDKEEALSDLRQRQNSKIIEKREAEDAGDFQEIEPIALNDQVDEGYPKVYLTSSTCMIGRIPDSSWIGWPARFYSEFGPEIEEHPKALFIFLVVFIIIIIILGKIFIKMGEWFEFINEIEHNPYAVLEH